MIDGTVGTEEGLYNTYSLYQPPSEQACYDAIDKVYNYVTTVRGICPDQIVLYGRSLGSGPSCYLAERLSLQGVVIHGVILQVLCIYHCVLQPLTWY